MCVMSMVTDHHIDKWGERYPQWPSWNPNQPYQPNNPVGPQPTVVPYQPINSLPLVPSPTKEEFDALKKEFEDFKKLAMKSIEYDERNNEPHCEMDEKVAIIRKLAEILGATADDIFPSE